MKKTLNVKPRAIHTRTERKIDYQAAADHCRDANYVTHARRLIECLSDEISWVYYESISFPASVKEMVTGKTGFHFDKAEVHIPPELIETHTYLLKESHISGAIGISAPAITKRPDSRGFQMSNMVGRTEEVLSKSYDKGHLVSHGALGGADYRIAKAVLVADSMQTISSAETLPQSVARRSLEIVRICSHLAQLVSLRPLERSGSIRTWVATFSPLVLRVRTMVFG
jgi:hypothetical protein